MTEWIKVEDRLPDLDEEVLYSDGRRIYLGMLDSDMGKVIYWTHYDSFEDYGITHWMPLPEKPNE